MKDKNLSILKDKNLSILKDMSSIWKEINRDTCNDSDNKREPHAFDLDIDLDNYEIDSFVPELREFIKEELNAIKLTKLTKYIRLKSFFNKWKHDRVTKDG